MATYTSSMMLNLCQFLYIIFITCSLSKAIVDLNSHQLQFIADHLTQLKCDELIIALHQTKFQIDPEILTTTTTTTAKTTTIMGMTTVEEPAPPACVTRLARWGRGPGRFQTFDVLVLRLKEIGMPKLANRVSKIVMHETSAELHRYFLDDPFKAMIPTKSILIDRPDESVKDVPAPVVADAEITSHEGMFRLAVVASLSTAMFLVAAAGCVLYRKTGMVVCQNACPDWLAGFYDVISDGFLRAWYGWKKSVGRYMLGSVPGQHESLAI